MISSTYRSRGMTVKTIPSSYSSDISIHIPRERCDRFGCRNKFGWHDFNPRTA